MLEKSEQVCRQLRDNKQQLGLSNIIIRCADATRADVVSACVPADKLDEKLDVVFVDPPFAQQFHQSAIDALENTLVLANNACVYIEGDKKGNLWKTPEHWTLVKEKTAGQVKLCLYRIERK